MEIRCVTISEAPGTGTNYVYISMCEINKILLENSLGSGILRVFFISQYKLK